MKDLLKTLEAISGVSTLTRGNPRKEELTSEILGVFIEHGDHIQQKFDEFRNWDGNRIGLRYMEYHHPGGITHFSASQFRDFQENKAYYTSPLMKALL